MLCRAWVAQIVYGLLFLFASQAPAQEPAPVTGDYSGVLGPLRLKLHITADTAGKLTGALDSLDQGANGIPVTNFKRDAKSLSFEVPAVKGSWAGTVNTDGSTLTGTWSQGSPMPLEFKRDTAFQAAAKPSAVDGIWLGTIQAGGQSLRAQLQVKSDAGGKQYCTFDSLDQNAMGFACANAALNENNFVFDVPGVRGHWSGTLSGEGKSLHGTWTQGPPVALDFTRQEKAAAPKPVAAPVFEPAKPAVSLAGLETSLDADLALARKDGALSAATNGGIVIGVIDHGARRIFAYGTATPEALFEIGSVTKTFTGLLLAQLAEQGKVKLDQPVRELLPTGTVAKPAGPEITLLDLATQHSGLPRMPDNFKPADAANPYVDYHAANLYAFLAQHGVARRAGATFLYSNLGVGLLGQALANGAETTYPALLATEITGPLHLDHTGIHLSAADAKHLIQGYDGQHHASHTWDLDAFAGAGAIRSTAADMLTYLAAQLHPETLESNATGSSSAATLAHALALSHQLRADAAPNTRIALAWLYNSETGSYWHNGATGGYSSYVFFNPQKDFAAVVLFNTSVTPQGSFADRVGQHVEQRLTGKPAISLAP